MNETSLSPEEAQEVEEASKKITITKLGLGKREKIVVFSVLGGTLLLLIASGLIIYFQITGGSVGPTAPVNQNVATPTNTNVTAPTNTSTNTEPTTYDQDGDGLPDEEELTIWKTSVTKKDTDGDGLSDFDEVRTYNTDPRSKDTDNDGYSDGDEINQGYNPLGSGRL